VAVSDVVDAPVEFLVAGDGDRKLRA
jgi:hypothetical protein